MECGGGGEEEGLVEVAAEECRQVVGVVQRRPEAAGRGVRGGRSVVRGGRGAPRARQRYLARQLGREGGQPGRRQLAQRRVRVLHQRLVRIRLPSAPS